MQDPFLEITLLFTLATALALVAKRLKIPILLAYILSGVIIGPLGIFGKITSLDTIELLSHFGVAFLLFLVGLELDIRELKTVGKTALATGLTQITFTAVMGFILVRIMGYEAISALYVSIALTFSSTIVVVKLLSDRNDINSLYGRMAIGFMLVQDLVAIAALMLLSSFTGGNINAGVMTVTLLKGFLLIGGTFVMSKYVLTPIIKYFSNPPELLLISSVSWAFLYTVIADKAGFSLEIGAFLAGIALAATPYRFEIGARVRSLRDFFMPIFFIVLGLSLSIETVRALWLPIIILFLLVSIGNPLVVMFCMRRLGQATHTTTLAAFSVGQIGEFSLIVITLGLRNHAVSQDLVSMIAFVSLLTITVSSIIMSNIDTLYRRKQRWFKYLLGKDTKYQLTTEKIDKKNHIILIGCHHMGEEILHIIQGTNRKVMVLDYDPKIVESLSKRGYEATFGDIGDPDVLEAMQIESADLIISTAPDFHDSRYLVKKARSVNPKIPILATASSSQEAKTLYSLGASYVVIPKQLGGETVAAMIADSHKDFSMFHQIGRAHLKKLIKNHQASYY